MSDRLQINFQERCESADINDLESMATRILADMYLFDQGGKLEGPDALVFPRNFIGGLNFIGDGGNNALLTPGFLAQFSLTHPAPPGPLDSALRLGFNRANLPIVLPVPAGPEFFLLEAQVVDVITVSSVRDVFDVPTQTFIPTLITKQVERQVTTQFVGGDVTDIPAPSGDPWVAIGSFIAPGVGPAPLDLITQRDFRQQVNDGSESNAPGAFPNDGAWLSGYLGTFSRAGGARTAGLVGHIEGKAFGQRYMMRSSPLASLVPNFEDGFANPPNTLVHFYMCPVTSGGVPFVLRQTVLSVSRKRGVLVASLVQPEILGRTNDSAITLPAPFSNLDGAVVAPNAALYIGSAYTDATGAVFHPFIQAEDGTSFNGDPTDLAPSPYPRVSRTGAIGAPVLLAFDLRTFIPDNVKAIYVKLRGGMEGGGGTAAWVLETVGGSIALANGFVNDHGISFADEYLWVPVGGNQDDLDFLNLQFSLVPLGAANLFFEAALLGWRT